MRFLRLCSLFALALTAAPASLHAQSDSYASASLKDSGKILLIVREYTKPGKDGASHEKTETQFARAMAAGKSTDYYTGMSSLTGVPRALFLSSYASLEDLAKTRGSMSPAVGAELDKINQADGDSLSGEDIAVFMRRDDLSTNVKTSPSKTRFIEITRFEVKAGHEQEFEQTAKLYMADMLKGVPSAHWTCYMSVFGHTQGTEYIFLTARKSLGEVDEELASGPAFEKAAGPQDLKKLSEALSSSVLNTETNLFHISPKLSYPSPDQVADDPGFWKPKPEPATAKPQPKPAP